MKIAITILILAISLFSRTSGTIDKNYLYTGTSISLIQDENGKINPEIDIPIISWSDNYFSGIGYYKTGTITKDTVEGFSDSKIGTTVETSNLKLNVLSFVTKLNSGVDLLLGYHYKVIDRDTNEFGYIHDTDSVFGAGNEWNSFDNEIEMKVKSHTIATVVGKKIGSNTYLKLNFNITPSSSMSLKQNTMFKPITSTDGASSGTKEQKLSYNYALDFSQKFGSLTLNINYSYDLLPLKYDLAQLARDPDDNTKFIFKTSEIDSEVETIRSHIKLIFPHNIVGTLHPSIGTGTIKEKTTIKGGTSTSEDTKEVFLFGLEKVF